MLKSIHSYLDRLVVKAVAAQPIKAIDGQSDQPGRQIFLSVKD
jgi:hypothetical protein